VKSLGGLYVIGTERHESRRIDNQLRGRSGRQGDPGRSKFFISMDDELMRLFGGERMKNLMTRLMGSDEESRSEPLEHKWLNRSIEQAQKKVEERNFEIRKHLLEYDDVLNQQRKFIYEQRDAILADKDLKKRVNDASADMVAAEMERLKSTAKKDALAAVKQLAEYLKTTFNLLLSVDGAANQPPEQLEQTVNAELLKDIDNKIALAGEDNLNAYIRMQYLMSIDRRWLDHLENMEALREAVYLRSYAQKNPLTEYKIEGFQIFDTMIDKIREEIASRTHLVRIQIGAERVAHTVGTAQSASHGSVGAFAGARQGGAAASATHAAAQNAAVTVVRSQPKVGRNDPCPCGSGKKYKNCHGR
jgi:preprotein translocase subunit SecA